MTTKGQLSTYDFTIWCDKITDDKPSGFDCSALQQLLHQLCKRWVFQIEETQDGIRHYQGRFSLKKKAYMHVFLKRYPVFKCGHLTPTQRGTHTARDFNYVMKADSRVAGPFSDESYSDPGDYTPQVINFLKHDMYPWQNTIMDYATQYNEREIALIYDHVGDIGKSVFQEYLVSTKKAMPIPPYRNMDDILQFAFCQPNFPCYMIDMPRGMKKDKLGEFYSGLETLKNGFVHDKRYKSQYRYMPRPQVIVFTNTLPQFDLMSTDRWVIFEMTKDKALIKKRASDFTTPPIEFELPSPSKINRNHPSYAVARKRKADDDASITTQTVQAMTADPHVQQLTKKTKLVSDCASTFTHPVSVISSSDSDSDIYLEL